VSAEPDAPELVRLSRSEAESVRAGLPGQEGTESAAETARAFADPTRLRLVLALRGGGELCVSDLARVCSIRQNLASHHLRRLRSASLVASRREGTVILYRLRPRVPELLDLLVQGPGDPAHGRV
jgi:ArsR family transcriptional regulator, lead/cadmium/zinc/bismuth-responsive transcriptional repressor